MTLRSRIVCGLTVSLVLSIQTQSQVIDPSDCSAPLLLTIRSESGTSLKSDDIQMILVEQRRSMPTATLANAGSAPLDIILVFDTSASAYRSGMLKEAVSAASNFVAAISAENPKVRYAAIQFGTSAKLIHDFSSDPISARSIKLSAGGGTAFNDALVLAGQLAFKSPPENRRIVVAISDGVDNQSRHTRNEAIEALARVSAILYAIALDSSRESSIVSGMDFLNAFTAVTGGRAFSPSKKNVAKSFDALKSELQNQYFATFKIPAEVPSSFLKVDYKIDVRNSKIRGPRIICKAPQN